MAKKQPAKKAKRKAAPKTVYAVWWWYQGGGEPSLYHTTTDKKTAERWASYVNHSEVIAYHREVLPRTRTRKGER